MTTTLYPPPQDGSDAPRGARPAGAGVVRALALIGASAGVALALSACGGNDDDNNQPATQVPASAAQSDAALEAFAISQPQSETAEPLALDNVPTLPSSETEDPIAVP
jgi:hypothetical protein